MGIFFVFKIVQMVLNRTTQHVFSCSKTTMEAPLPKYSRYLEFTFNTCYTKLRIFSYIIMSAIGIQFSFL